MLVEICYWQCSLELLLAVLAELLSVVVLEKNNRLGHYTNHIVKVIAQLFPCKVKALLFIRLLCGLIVGTASKSSTMCFPTANICANAYLMAGFIQQLVLSVGVAGGRLLSHLFAAFIA